MHLTQTKLFHPEIHIQHIKTIKFQETNMRSRAKIFNEPKRKLSLSGPQIDLTLPAGANYLCIQF